MASEPPQPRATFDTVADVYHRVRPGYPPALFDDLFAMLPDRPRLVEVGPGTGQATRDLLARGAIVHAVELGPAMATTLRREVSSPDLTITVGDFEEVPSIAEGTYDALFSATAYHWIEPSAQVARPAQLLEAGGLVAIVDLIQVDSDVDRGFFDAVQPIYERYGEGRGDSPPPPRRHEVDPPMRAHLDRDERFATPAVRTYDWDQTYRAAEYRELLTSYSGTQTMAPAARDAFLDDMERFVVERFDGVVTRPIVVTLTTARRR